MYREQNASKKVLLVEDTFALATVYQQYLRTFALATVYQQYLRAMGLDVTAVENGAKCLASIAASPPEVVVLDLGLPDMEGVDILKKIRAANPDIAVVVITNNASMGLAVETMRLGAFDYVVKPFTADRLSATIRNAMAQVHYKRKLKPAPARLDMDFQGFIGRSPKMLEIYRLLENAGPSSATVFITGESGTGKEICATAVHNLSGRKNGPFVTLNCAAIPHDLLESELFGHVKGAFTGAISDRWGAVKMSSGGTLFLDEVCELHLDLQAKLLRLLQNGTYQRVGSSKVEEADMRVVCATNKDPKAEVKAGHFREDLYYRLQVIPVHLPPLRERGYDIIQIANALLEQYASHEGKIFEKFSSDAQSKLVSYAWPGNIREMQNAIRNAIVLNNGKTIESSMLPISIPAPEENSASKAETKFIELNGNSKTAHKIKPLWQVEREAMIEALEYCNGNTTRAAALLEIGVSTLHRKKIEHKLSIKRSA